MNHKTDYKYSIIDCIEFNENEVVLFDFEEFPIHKQAINLVCFDKNGTVRWEAKHPTNTTSDCYVSFAEREEQLGNSIPVNNFIGCICYVSLETGDIDEVVYTK